MINKNNNLYSQGILDEAIKNYYKNIAIKSRQLGFGKSLMSYYRNIRESIAIDSEMSFNPGLLAGLKSKEKINWSKEGF